MRVNARLAIATIVALLGAALALPAFAQSSTTGVIEGVVKDEKGEPVADATITAVSGQAPFTALTDAKGRYQLPNLPGGLYNVRGEASGKGAVVQEGVQVQIGRRTQLDFILNTGIIEAVTVTSEAPLIDAKSTTIGATFTVEEYVNSVPIGRNFSNTFTLAPGVADGGGTGAGNYSISGSSGLENSYIIDGVNITNTGYGGIGSYNIVYGSLGTGVTSEFLEEVQVKTGGIDAEYGQATGGVINTVVKSGTNNFEASAAAYYGEFTQGFAQVHNSSGAVNQDADSTNTLDLAVHAGGSILKDKLFYFGAYNRVSSEAGATIEPLDLNTAYQRRALPGADGERDRTPWGTLTYPVALAGPQIQERTNDNWAAKLTWYANPNHRLELSGFGDPSDGKAGPQAFAGLRNLNYFTLGGGQSEIQYGANNYSLKYDGALTSNLFLQAQISRHDGEFREVSTLDHSRVRDRRQELAFLTGAAANSATWFTGGTGFLSNADDLSDQYKVTATWVLGNHEIKGGVQYDDVEYTDDQAYTGPSAAFIIPLDGDGSGTYTDAVTPCPGDNPGFDCVVTLNSTSGTLIDYRGKRPAVHNWRSIRARFYPTPPPTTTTDLNFFAQDTWSFHPRWTLKAGVRVTSQEITGAGGFTLPSREVGRKSVVSNHAHVRRRQLQVRHGVRAPRRRDVGRAGGRQDQDLRERRAVLRAHPERPRGSLAVERSRHFPVSVAGLQLHDRHAAEPGPLRHDPDAGPPDHGDRGRDQAPVRRRAAARLPARARQRHVDRDPCDLPRAGSLARRRPVQLDRVDPEPTTTGRRSTDTRRSRSRPTPSRRPSVRTFSPTLATTPGQVRTARRFRVRSVSTRQPSSSSTSASATTGCSTATSASRTSRATTRACTGTTTGSRTRTSRRSSTSRCPR